jgi:hypothetical protein
MEGKDLISLAMAFAALLISLFGLLYTRDQLKRTRVSERGRLFKELYEKFFDDEDMAYVYYLAEKGESIFTQSHGSADPREREHRQKAIERLLAHLEVVCALYRNRLLEQEDMGHFHYNIQRLSQFSGFDWYRDFLEEEWPRQRNLDRGPYSSLFWYIDTQMRNNTPRPRRRAA